MDKKEALSVLINHSFLLSDKVKADLMLKLEEMSEEDVTSLGRFLALEKKKSLGANRQMIDSIDEVLRTIAGRMPDIS